MAVKEEGQKVERTLDHWTQIGLNAKDDKAKRRVINTIKKVIEKGEDCLKQLGVEDQFVLNSAFHEDPDEICVCGDTRHDHNHGLACKKCMCEKFRLKTTYAELEAKGDLTTLLAPIEYTGGE